MILTSAGAEGRISAGGRDSEHAGAARSGTRDADASAHDVRRLDAAIVLRGLADSRSRAQRLIKADAVRVNDVIARKASQPVLDADTITLDKGDDYASRGAYKLLGALEHFMPLGLPSPAGRNCLDIGASTGGFTDVLLRNGARSVVALDVGHGQLIERLRRDPRVIAIEGMNIRDVDRSRLPFAPDYVVSDVSFISLTYVIPVIAAISSGDTHCVLLVKPQFEVGREQLGRHGIVTDESNRLQSVEHVRQCAQDHGFTVEGCIPSPIVGTHGNVEFLLWLHRSL
ncbi:TlyA family RNA methyltransferase [Bifidobacterium psychraerophilum]|uniref:TlyA family RNA methyltransferase n=1 Tax=Bifidobacterium psychraerophilum TaxID=218140 RepID=UPI0009DD7CDB|nr:TlyA family RNA methyltransferase [Bifidobacterium psychraerophilum]